MSAEVIPQLFRAALANDPEQLAHLIVPTVGTDL
jgi:hypothetical protein